MLRNEIPGSHGTLYTGIVDRLSLSQPVSASLSHLDPVCVGGGLGRGGHMHTHASLRVFKGEDGFSHI